MPRIKFVNNCYIYKYTLGGLTAVQIAKYYQIIELLMYENKRKKSAFNDGIIEE